MPNNLMQMLRPTIRPMLYLLLFPLFFVLHGYNENFNVISWSLILELFAKYVLLTGLIVIFALSVLKNSNQIFVFAFFCLCIFFFFGSIHDFLKLHLTNQKLSSYSVLLPSLFIILVLSIIGLRRSKKKYLRIASYIKVLLVFFVIFESGALIYKTFQFKKLVGGTASLPGINKRMMLSGDVQPDIFFIVFDGYTSSLCLKQDFEFDNSSLDSLLKQHNFFISQSSKSNYNLTPFSLGSVLNATYLKVDSQEYVITQKDILSAVNTVENNWVIPFFQEQGYMIKNFGVFNFKSAAAATFPYFGKDYFVGAIDDQTMLSRTLHDISWNFTLKNIFTGAFRIPKSYFRKKKEYLDRNQFNYDQLIKELQANTSSPRFVYCHIMLPHEPYYFNADGSLVSDTAILLRQIDEKAGYLNQIQYSNLLLKKIIELSEGSSKRKRVVIIMGDHGYRSYPSKMERSKTFMNLNCVYATDGVNYLYNGFSPVNTFRFIVNKYFGQTLPFLKDSSIYLVDPKYDIP